MKTFFFIIAALFVVLSPLTATADTPAQIAARLQAVYDATRTFSASFSQKTSLKNSSRTRRGAGSLLLAKPGRVRWDYKSPEEQVIICDGKTIRMYFARSHQLVESDAGRYLANDITTAFFMGRGRIADDFDIRVNPLEDSRFPYRIRLVPKKSHPQVKQVDLWLDEGYRIRRLDLLDHFGSVTEIELSDLKSNIEVADEAFSFTPPEGTEIVRQ